MLDLSVLLLVFVYLPIELFDIFDANKEKRLKYLIIRDRLFQVTSQSDKSFEIYRNKCFTQLYQILRSDYYFYVKASYKHIFDSVYN